MLYMCNIFNIFIQLYIYIYIYIYNVIYILDILHQYILKSYHIKINTNYLHNYII